MPTYLYKDLYNVTSYPYTGGLIGNELLRRFNLIVNYPQREINLIPNSHYYDSFEYGYTGLSIYQIDGRITVDATIPVRLPKRRAFRKTMKSSVSAIIFQGSFSNIKYPPGAQKAHTGYC